MREQWGAILTTGSHMPMNFERISYFLQVCENGSVSKAAEKLYISPQALNKQIRVLEENLGKKLFHRTSRSLTLTDFGAYVERQMRPVHHLYTTAQEQVKQYLSDTKRTLRVGFFQGVPKRRVIQPILTELMVELPDVQIELGSAEMDEVYADLRSKKIDLAITHVKAHEKIPDLVQIPLVAMPCTIVVSYMHPWMAKESVGIEDMAQASVLFLSRPRGKERDDFYSKLNAASCHFAPTYNAMLAQLGLGQHYAVFPTLFENLSEIGLKTFPLPPEYEFEFVLSILYHPENRFASFFSELNSLQSEFRNLDI